MICHFVVFYDLLFTRIKQYTHTTYLNTVWITTHILYCSGLFSDNIFLQITELANELYTTRTHYEEDLAEKDSITSQQNSEIISLKEELVRH